jgi:hypothetical protein
MRRQKVAPKCYNFESEKRSNEGSNKHYVEA